MIETAVLIAVIVGVVEVIKRAFLVPSRFAPLIAIILGMAATLSIEGVSAMVAFEGLIAGLSASGLYSGTKATLE